MLLSHKWRNVFVSVHEYVSRMLASQIFSCIHRLLTLPLIGWVQMVQRYDENGLIFIYIDAFIIFKVEDLFFTDLFCIFNILWTYYFTFYISFNWLSFPFMMLAGRKFNFHYGISHMLYINFFFHFMYMNCYIRYGDILLKEDYILNIHFHET